MALTPAEKQRAYRERQKDKHKEDFRKGGDAAADLFRTPFSVWEERNGLVRDLIEYTSLAGFELPPIEDERDPEEFVIDRAAHGDGDILGDAKGALGRVEVTVGVLIDTAMLLAEAVNRYKREEIEARLAELAGSAETERAAAMKEAVRLNKILNQLNKVVRRDFPQWKVEGA